MITDPSYDPYDIFSFEEAERLKELDNALNKVRTKGNGKHEEAVREEAGEIGILRQPEQKESRIEQVAPIKRKPGRPPKGR